MTYLTDPKQLRGLYGFLHEEVPGAAPRPYVSNSWTLLKGKCLELGAHRVNGEEGTGRDLREVIQRIDSHELARTVAALNPVDLRTHTELGYDEGRDVGARFAQVVVWTRRNESVSLTALLNEAIAAAADSGYSSSYGYSEDFVDGIHRGILDCTETSAQRLQTLDDALEAQSAEWPGTTAAELLAGSLNREQKLSRKASYQHRQGKGLEELVIEPAPIQALLEEVNELITNLGHDYPATAAECAGARDWYASEGDVENVRLLGQLLLNESDNPSDRTTIAALDRFLLEAQDEWREHEDGINAARELARKHNEAELWIGGTDTVIGADVLPDVESVRGTLLPKTFNPDYEVTAPLPDFRFITRLDANRRALLGDAIVQAVLDEGRTIVVSPALNDDVAGLYVTNEGWETEDEA